MITHTEITFMTFVISSLSLLVMQKKQKYSETFIINDEHEQHRWGLPDILGHGGGMVGEVEDRERESPSWQTGCLNPAHMGHLTVIKSCGIKPLQPEPVKLINSLVFPMSQRKRERDMHDQV